LRTIGVDLIMVMVTRMWHYWYSIQSSLRT